LAAAKCRKEKEIFELFGVTDRTKREVKRWLVTIRRMFKFVNGDTMVRYNLVNDCLAHIGFTVKTDRSEVERNNMMMKRAKLVPAIQKLVTFALVEERCVVVKAVKKMVESGTCFCLVAMGTGG